MLPHTLLILNTKVLSKWSPVNGVYSRSELPVVPTCTADKGWDTYNKFWKVQINWS